MSWFTPLRWYAVCGVLCGLSIAVILWRLPVLLASGGHPGTRRSGVEPEGVQALLERAVPAGPGKIARIGNTSADYLVLVIFTPGDCPAGVAELEDLERAVRARPDVQAFAVMSFSNPDEALQTKQSFHLTFPILQDPDGSILRALKPPKTPWNIVIQRSNSRILFEAPGSVSLENRRAFIERLSQLRIAS